MYVLMVMINDLANYSLSGHLIELSKVKWQLT